MHKNISGYKRRMLHEKYTLIYLNTYLKYNSVNSILNYSIKLHSINNLCTLYVNKYCIN